MEIKKSSIEICRSDDDGFIVYEKNLSIEEDGKEIWDNSVDVIGGKDDEKETMTALLQMIAWKMGIMPDKFSKDNLNITWDKNGSKVE